MNSSKFRVGTTAGIFAASSLSAYYAFKCVTSKMKIPQLKNDREHRLIVITGCDSGLGFSMAAWAASLGYKVLAGCLDENGLGANYLRRQYPDKVTVAQLNVTDVESLNKIHKACIEILQRHEGNLHLWAVVANAAVCTMGEFFWQTQRQLEQQMDVNFWGAVNFVSEFKGLLFKNKARVIIVGSDCSEYPLPFLSTYCASKAALNAWAQSFRFEVAKYGVPVVSYHPRDFAKQSGLFSNIELHSSEMLHEMCDNDKIFYGDYFHKFMEGKKRAFIATNTKKPVKPLDSPHHKETFISLLDENIQSIPVHRNQSWMEFIFHLLYSRLPQRLADSLVHKLLIPDTNVIWKPVDYC